MIDMHVGFTGGEFGGKPPAGYFDVARRQVDVVRHLMRKQWQAAARAQVGTWMALGTVATRDARAWLDRLRSR
jgi:hypothetical protein